MKPILVMAVASMLGLSGCSLARWEGFVYPNKKDPKAHLNIGRYWSYDGCREAAIETLNKKGAVQTGRYECGLNCEPQTDSDKPRICEKTEP